MELFSEAVEMMACRSWKRVGRKQKKYRLRQLLENRTEIERTNKIAASEKKNLVKCPVLIRTVLGEKHKTT